MFENFFVADGARKMMFFYQAVSFRIYMTCEFSAYITS